MSLRHFLNRSWVTILARFSMTRKSGTSKQSPKPMIIAIQYAMYVSAVYRIVKPPDSELKKASPRLIAMKAKKQPRPNSGTAVPRKA